MLAAIGRFTRERVSFPLMLAAAGWGVIREAIRPVSWRRTVRHEFNLTMRQTILGGFGSTAVTACLAGVGMVYESLYWLGMAGEAQLTSTVLVTVLLRELMPLLVGLILLGRSGMLTLTELTVLQTSGQARTMLAQGIDPFLVFVLPRTLAFAIASFTLGMIFAAFALVFGYVVSNLLGSVHDSLGRFLSHLVGALAVRDYLIIPAKLLAIGYLVGLGSCLTGLTASPDDELASVMPRGFVHGILSIMITDILLTVAS